MNLNAEKPLTLPREIVEMLRGERGFVPGSRDLALLARGYYLDGRADRSYAGVPEAPAAAFWSAELTAGFLWACWKLGRKDSPANAANVGGGKAEQVHPDSVSIVH